MSLLYIIILIAAVVLLLWLINSLIPMEPTVKRILNVVVILVMVIFLLKALGVFAFLGGVRV